MVQWIVIMLLKALYEVTSDILLVLLKNFTLNKQNCSLAMLRLAAAP